MAESATAVSAAPAAAVPAGKAAEPAKGAAPAASAPKGQIFKINGKDWSEADLAQRLQKAEGLEKRVADADRYEKAFTNLTARLDDPEQFVSLLNSPEFKYDEDKQAALAQAMLASKKPKVVQAIKQWLYENEVEPSTLTEDQRRLRELERENNKFKTEAQKAEEQRKAQELAVQAKAIYQDYVKKISEGLKANNLPMHEFVVKMALNYAKVQRINNKQPFDIAGAMKYTKDFLTGLNADVEKWDDATILNAFPEGALKKINAAYISRLKKASEGSEPKKAEAGEPHPFKRKTKQEATSKENKDFWKNVGRGIFAA